MTIPGSMITKSGPYLGTGLVSEFDVDFIFLADADLRVIRRTIATGADEDLTLNSDYTVTGAGEPTGGTVTLTAGALAATYSLTIVLAMDSAQETDLVHNNLLNNEVVETALDRLTLLIKQVEEGQERCLQVSPASDVSLVLDELLEGIITDSVVEVGLLVDSAESYSSAAGAYAAEAGVYMSGASAYAAAALIYSEGSARRTWLDEPTPPTSSSGITVWGETSASTGYTDLKAISTSGAEFYIVQSGRVYLGDMDASDVANHNHYSSASGGNIATSGTGTSDIPAKCDHYHSVAVVQERRAQGTHAGGSSVGNNQRVMTNETDPDGIVTLSGGDMILGPGRYLLTGWAVGYPPGTSGNHFLSLYDVTGVPAIIGYHGPGGKQTSSTGNMRVSVSAPLTVASGTKTIRLYHYTSWATASYGLGYAMNVAGWAEVYAEVSITKVG
jgi:hypothetical protein